MNHIFLLTFLFIASLLNTYSQSKSTSVTYKTENNISYRSGENLSDYEKERCKLDIYFPENVDSFTTVVWFHGGGLTEGEKSVPERLKNHKLAAFVSYSCRCTADLSDYRRSRNGNARSVRRKCLHVAHDENCRSPANQFV